MTLSSSSPSGQRSRPDGAPGGILGLDIGGAHLKLALLDPAGRPLALRQVACALWQGLDRLDAAFDAALAGLPPPSAVAVTMTGELVDLFSDREEGVRAILDRVAERFPDLPVRVYAGRTGLLDLAAARGRAREVASANWRATAELVAGLLPEALLVDCGSTTTDILPVAGGRVSARGIDDRSRLAWGELVYQGVVRTPLCALAERAPFRGVWHGLMNEWFATTADVYRLLGLLDEACDLHPAADNGPKTPQASARRLARMIGCDLGDGDVWHWRMLAEWFAARQLAILEEAARLVLSRGELGPDAPLVAAGAGAFLVARLGGRLGRPVLRFEDLPGIGDAGREASVVAPALAVARLLLVRPPEAGEGGAQRGEA